VQGHGADPTGDAGAGAAGMAGGVDWRFELFSR
jgi:hypothetical protein